MPIWFLTYWRYIAAAALVVVFLFYRSCLISEGEDRVKAADEKAAAAQVIHNAEVQARAKVLAQVSVDEFKATRSAPPAPDAPHVRVCHNTPNPGPLPAHDSAGSSSAGDAGLPSTGAEDHDIGPALDALLRDADAEIRAWQGYYFACRDNGLCEK